MNYIYISSLRNEQLFSLKSEFTLQFLRKIFCHFASASFFFFIYNEKKSMSLWKVHVPHGIMRKAAWAVANRHQQIAASYIPKGHRPWVSLWCIVLCDFCYVTLIVIIIIRECVSDFRLDLYFKSNYQGAGDTIAIIILINVNWCKLGLEIWWFSVWCFTIVSLATVLTVFWDYVYPKVRFVCNDVYNH